MQGRCEDVSFGPYSSPKVVYQRQPIASVVRDGSDLIKLESFSNDVAKIVPRPMAGLAEPFHRHGQQLMSQGNLTQSHRSNSRDGSRHQRLHRNVTVKIIRRRHMIRKDEKEYLERRYIENPFFWDARTTEEISILLKMPRKKVTQWRYVRSRKDPRFLAYQQNKRARRQQLQFQ